MTCSNCGDNDSGTVFRHVCDHCYIEMVRLLDELAADLEAEISDRWRSRDTHEVQMRKFDRDMAPVRAARRLIAKHGGEDG